MARSWAARRPSRSTRSEYLRASSAYLVRNTSPRWSSSGVLAMVGVARFQRGDLRGQVGHPGHVLERDHRAERAAAVENANGRDACPTIGSVGELVGDSLDAQRGVLAERVGDVPPHSVAA